MMTFHERMFFMDVLPSWEMYFDGVVQHDGAGVRVVLVSPKKHILPYSYALT